MEASALQAPATLAQPRVTIPTPLLRFRSDEQLVALFRAGHDEAFRAIHDRYNKRLFAYARQMLPGRQDAEDALQDVFVRAYSGLRASDRDLALRAWLFRVAHNRCIDELRRPAPPAPEVLQLVRSVFHDPVAEADIRESLRRLIDDVRRLPDQQRSALLLRELGGMSYAELAASLGISVGAVKSLLVRARIALAQAATARDTACSEIHEELVEAYERGLRPNANARRHMRDCAGCRGFRRELRGVNRRLAALGPAVGPLGLLTKVLGFTGGAGGGATAGGAALVGGTGAAAGTGGALLGAGHVATLIAAAVATAGGAVEIQHTISAPSPRPPAHVRVLAKHAQRYVAPSEPPAPPATYAPAADPESTQATVPSAASDVTKSKIVALERVKSPVKSALRSGGPNGTGGGAMFGPQTSSPSTTSATTGASLRTTDLLDGEGTSTATGDSSGSSSTTTGTGGSTTSNTSTSGTSSTSGSSTGSSSGSTSTTTGGSSSSPSGTTSSGTSSTSSSGSGSGSTSGSSTSSSGSGSPVPPK